MNTKLLRAEWRALRRAAVRVTHRGLSVVGIAAIGGAVFLATHPDDARSIGRWVLPVEPSAPAEASSKPVDPLVAAIAAPGSEASRVLGLSASANDAVGEAIVPDDRAVRRVDARTIVRQKQDAVGYLAKKYRVNSDAVAMLVDAAWSTGREVDLDPLLLLAVVGVESGFNPFAESSAGASGLMQLMSKVHADKLADFGGARVALNPVVNMRVGAAVLKDCIRRGGSVAEGLRLYVGAGTGDDAGYGARVLLEKERLAQAIRGLAPRIEPIPTASPAVPKARDSRAHQPDIDHSYDTADPTDPKVDAAAGRIAAL